MYPLDPAIDYRDSDAEMKCVSITGSRYYKENKPIEATLTYFGELSGRFRVRKFVWTQDDDDLVKRLNGFGFLLQ